MFLLFLLLFFFLLDLVATTTTTTTTNDNNNKNSNDDDNNNNNNNNNSNNNNNNNNNLVNRSCSSCDSTDDGNGKNQPKRGPGRPRKRKYFGAGTKFPARPSSAASSGNSPEFEACAFEVPLNGTQSLSLWRADSEESLVTKDAEPVKKKKKKTKGQNKDLSPLKTPTLSPTENEVRNS